MYTILEESSTKVAKSSTKVAKKPKSIVCELCDYSSSRKCNIKKHLATQKHKKNAVNYTKFCNKSVTNDDNCMKKNFICEICDRSNKNRMGLWRHKKVCTGKNEILEDDNEYITIKKSKYIKVLENAAHNRKIDIRKIDNRKIDNRKIDNSISINLFLNEHCKNAICIEDFISGIKLTLEDLLSHKDLGYADSMSNVLIKNLEKIPGTKRPIHSTDIKRLKFMVKKADGWEKDDGTTVNNVVREVKFKQVDKINEWEIDNPNFQNNTEKMIEWNDMMSVFDTGTNKKAKDKNNKSIKKNIATSINIKDLMGSEL
jgi:hypothetical protein